MINATDRPVVRFQGAALHRAIVAAMAAVTEMLERVFDRRASLTNAKHFGFYALFGAGKPGLGVVFDESFLQTCFDVSQGDSQNRGNRDARKDLAAYATEPMPANGLPSLKRGLKLMLIELWCNGVVLLPTTFTVGPGFAIGHFEHPLHSWLKGYDPAGQAEGAGSSDARRLFYYGPRLLWTTDWQQAADINLKDLAELQRAALRYQNQLSSVVIGGGHQLPFTLIAAQALQHFPDEVLYSAEDLAKYSRWVLSRKFDSQSFEEYVAMLALPQKDQPTRSPPSRRRKPKPGAVWPMAPPGDGDVHDALRLNFINLQKRHRKATDWATHDQPVYIGREHVSLHDIAPKWVEAMRAFMHHRRNVQEYRSSSEAVAALNILADYLYFYLPWWRELAKAPKVDVPRSPRELTRFAFVSRHTSESHDEFPETLLTAIGWRRKSNDTVAMAVHQLKLFFSFVETHFAEDENIAGFGFRSPLNPEFDAPKGSSRTKTTKEVIPKHIYSYLLFYCYAVEEAGIKLEKLALTGELKGGHGELQHAQRLCPADFGFSISVKYRSSALPLLEVPNVFQWANRELRVDQGAQPKTVFVPHCTALRLLLTSVETGLRCQSVQWLDRRTWRREAPENSAGDYTYPLYVNTDKTRVEPWVTYVVYRVRDLLRRQEDFQIQFSDVDAFEAVAYENSENAPFDRIEPLFRSVGSGAPITDSLYYYAWRRLMVGFEAFYRAVTGERHVKLFKLEPLLDPEDKPVVRSVRTGVGSPLYCPLRLLAVHTPHACRATFATNRKGILDLSDAAQLLGHLSEISTAHYDKPPIEDLRERLRESDQEQCRDFLQFDPESEVHVRSDKPDSALIRSFNKDRGATINAFRFMPGVSLWSTSDGSKDDAGLKLLREGPMSRIRFRETHICPVGEECPAEVLERIGAPRRCGCCPLAARCVEHLPAIAAKQNQLLERIRYLHGRYKLLEAHGEPVAVLDEIWDEMELDANEYLGWQLSEKFLSKEPAEGTDGTHSPLHVEQPEVVKRHLVRVSRSCSLAETMLQRIADSNAYPSMATPQVQIAAAQVKRRLLAGQGQGAIEWEDEGVAAVKDAAALLGVAMKATGLSREQVARALSSTAVADTMRLLTGVVDEI